MSINLQLSLFVHDALNGKLPPGTSQFYSLMQHSYHTRSKDKGNLLIPKYNTNSGQHSIKYAGAKVWNKLPENIRVLSSRNSFKKQMKHFLEHD